MTISPREDCFTITYLIIFNLIYILLELKLRSVCPEAINMLHFLGNVNKRNPIVEKYDVKSAKNVNYRSNKAANLFWFGAI